MNLNLSRRSQGMLIALVATTAWATTAILISDLLRHYPLQPLTLAFWRDFIVGITLVGLLLCWQPAALRLSWPDVPFFLAYGFVGLAVFNGLWTYSVKYNGAAVATVLAYSSPAFTVLLAAFGLRESITPRKLIAVGLSLAGCVFVAKAYSPEQWQLNPAGILVGLGTGLAFACYNLGGRWSAKRFANPWTVTTYGFLFAALGLALTQNLSTATSLALSERSGFFFANPAFSLGAVWQGWLILIILAVGPTLAGFGLYTVSLRYLPASLASLIASLEPVLTAVMAIFILGESLSLQQWLGAGLILLAIGLVRSEDDPASEA